MESIKLINKIYLDSSSFILSSVTLFLSSFNEDVSNPIVSSDSFPKYFMFANALVISFFIM